MRDYRFSIMRPQGKGRFNVEIEITQCTPDDITAIQATLNQRLVENRNAED